GDPSSPPGSAAAAPKRESARRSRRRRGAHGGPEMSASYECGCFCGAVRFTVSGEPPAMGSCHCESCRHWSAGPVNAFSLWPEASVEVTQGAEQIGTYNKTAASYRKWCKQCG